MSNAERKDTLTMATYWDFRTFFESACEGHTPESDMEIERSLDGGHSIKITRTRTPRGPRIDVFGVYVHSPQLDNNELVYFNFDKKGLGEIAIDNREIVVEGYDLPNNRDFARLSRPLTWWLVKCFQDGKYRPLSEGIREQITEFAQISSLHRHA